MMMIFNNQKIWCCCCCCFCWSILSSSLLLLIYIVFGFSVCFFFIDYSYSYYYYQQWMNKRMNGWRVEEQFSSVRIEKCTLYPHTKPHTSSSSLLLWDSFSMNKKLCGKQQQKKIYEKYKWIKVNAWHSNL